MQVEHACLQRNVLGVLVLRPIPGCNDLRL